MPTTLCKIKNVDFKLEYTNTTRQANAYYWGTLFTKQPLQFSFKVTPEKVIFIPLNTEKFIIEAITATIQEL